MEAATEHLTSESAPTLPDAIQALFALHTAEETYTLILYHLFKAWACQPEEKKNYGEKEMAQFCDQIIYLVGAAERFHRENGGMPNSGKGMCRG